MNDRVALITGSTSGIGKATASLLSLEGFTVVYHSRSSVKEGRRLASLNENASYFQADLSNQVESKGLIEQVASKYGFYPVNTDTFKKPDNGHKECSCLREENTVLSSSKKPLH